MADGEWGRRIRVLLVDDNAPFRDLLATFISTQSDMEVVGAAEGGVEGVTLSSALRPDVVLMDLCMPDIDGFEATRRVKLDCPSTKVIALTAHLADENARRCKDAGAEAFMMKGEAGDRLIEIIRRTSPPFDEADPS